MTCGGESTSGCLSCFTVSRKTGQALAAAPPHSKACAHAICLHAARNAFLCLRGNMCMRVHKSTNKGQEASPLIQESQQSAPSATGGRQEPAWRALHPLVPRCFRCSCLRSCVLDACALQLLDNDEA